MRSIPLIAMLLVWVVSSSEAAANEVIRKMMPSNCPVYEGIQMPCDRLVMLDKKAKRYAPAPVPESWEGTFSRLQKNPVGRDSYGRLSA